MEYKRILTIQDISCLGQCSATVALPIISACGMECCVLPSAVLSTHTGGRFRETGYSCMDLTNQFSVIESYWKRAGISFDAVYTGYLGSTEQISLVKSIMESCTKKHSLKIVDPAMADAGALYPAFGEEYVKAMANLCSIADIVLPNITEAAFITGMDYRESYTESYVEELMTRLVNMGCRIVVLTGVGYSPETTGVAVFKDGRMNYYRHRRISTSYHGTGDVYSSAFTGALMSGMDTFEAAKLAADFTCSCIEDTVGDKDHWYGVKFEPRLGWLYSKLIK